MRAPSGFYGRRDDSPTPPVRNHDAFVIDGLVNEAHHKRLLDAGPDARRQGIFKKDYPYKKECHGVKECSPLRFLPRFDMVWDILPDMMHIMSGIWKRHIFELLKGGRAPSAVKARKQNTAAQNAALREEHAKCKERCADWMITKVTLPSPSLV